MEMLIPTIDVVDVPGTVRISGKIIARNVSYEDFMNGFEGQHVEWVNGVVIEMPSITEKHDAQVGFWRTFFKAYLEQTGGGRVVGDPMVMKLANVPSSRAPDIQVLLPERLHQLQYNQVIGPANLVVEIISPGSRRTDQVDKRREYELGGVPEYWILDPENETTTFLQLNEAGIYDEILPDSDGRYCSRSLSRFCFPVNMLWREPLPTVAEIVQMVADMLR